MQKIFNYYKQYGYKTIVMGASFRNVRAYLSLLHCKLTTICSPARSRPLLALTS